MAREKKKTYTYKIAYYDETGKRRGKTFTAPTRRLARLKAAEWELHHKEQMNAGMTVLDALNAYVDNREAILSPSSVRSYRQVIRSRFEDTNIGKCRIGDLNQVIVQAWINESVGKLSAKTIIDHYRLFKAAVTAQNRFVDFSLISLPQKEKTAGFTPTDAQIKAIIEYTKKQERPDLYHAVLLCSFGLLRRSEVCAVTSDDIHGNVISINKAMVKDEFGTWVIKTTKTVESTRDIEYPQFVIDELNGIQGRLVPVSPDALSRRFTRALKYAKLPHFGLHGLRRYGASIMHALGIPDIYIQDRGGWATPTVMRKIYINEMDDVKRREIDKINAHFASL